jgi:hypothetical protein
MKQLSVISFFLLFIGCKVMSQKPQENTTYNDPYINKFVGNWIWISGTDTVKLKLQKKLLKIVDFNNSYWERILGCHVYVKNGLLVESSMNQFDSLQYYTNEHKIGSIRLARFQDDDTAYIGGFLKYISTNKGVVMDLTYLGGTPAQIRMKLSYKQGTTISVPGKPYIDGVTLPKDIILNKE